MRPAVGTALRCAAWVVWLGLVGAGVAAAQSRQPLRKSDLIRHLSGSVLSKGEIADLIRRNCLSFTPTDRDRADLRALGADDRIMRSVDACVRRAASPAMPLRVESDQASVAADVGSEATITVKLLRGQEVARGARLVLLGSSRIPGGLRRDAEATTDGLGVATFRVPTGTAPGTYQLTVVGAGGERLEGRTAIALEATPTGGLRADVRPGRIEIRPGDDRWVPVTVAVRDGRGNPLPGQPVELRAAAGTVFTSLTGTSNAQGEVVLAVGTAAFRGAATLEVRVRGRAVGVVEIALPAVVSASRTGFVSGVGQRGRVGTRLPQPLVFEVRDTANAPVAARTVVFLAAGARLEQVSAATDSNGRAEAYVLLGERAGPVVVSARVGAIERQVPLYAVAGPPAKLVVSCGAEVVEGRLAVPADEVALLRVAAQDAYGNLVPLGALRASVGDDRLLRQVSIVSDSLGGVITFRPGKGGGTTNLVVLASGLRASFVASVQPRGASRDAGCG